MSHMNSEVDKIRPLQCENCRHVQVPSVRIVGLERTGGKSDTRQLGTVGFLSVHRSILATLFSVFSHAGRIEIGMRLWSWEAKRSHRKAIFNQ